MQPSRAANTADSATDAEYRVIETALLETARGRWFLAEFGRRARRLDAALLEDSIDRLKSSLRQPPALLGQLQAEISELRSFLAQAHENLLAKAQSAGPAGGEPAAAGILRGAEELHELAWTLQANDINAGACESIGRAASAIYALSVQQAVESQRATMFADAIDASCARIDGILETLSHEAVVDHSGSPSEQEVAALSALIDQDTRPRR